MLYVKIMLRVMEKEALLGLKTTFPMVPQTTMKVILMIGLKLVVKMR
jgi:hypothetical protein